MKDFTEEELDAMFRKVRHINGCDQDEWYIDASGAIIKRSSHGRTDELYGWEVDHIVPESLLRAKGVPQEMIDDDINLRPLNWNNNVSKGDDYPIYRIAVEADSFQESNDAVDKFKEVSTDKQSRLREFYKDYISL